MKKQVDKSHYKFSCYVDKLRWISIWHQLDEVIKLNPGNVLEVGPGPGLFKGAAKSLGVHVETLDLDPELEPDHVASVFDIPFEDNAFDVVCAFQMLEHLPFDQSLLAFRELVRVAKNAVVISLPDAATRWPISIHVPKVGLVQFSLPRPRLVALKHKFDGEHYWEINKAGYSFKHVKKELLDCGMVSLLKTFRVHENPYHRIFVFEKENNNKGCSKL